MSALGRRSALRMCRTCAMSALGTLCSVPLCMHIHTSTYTYTKKINHYLHTAALSNLPTKDHTTVTLSLPYTTAIFHYHVASFFSEILLCRPPPQCTHSAFAVLPLGHVNYASLTSDVTSFPGMLLLGKYTNTSLFS